MIGKVKTQWIWPLVLLGVYFWSWQLQSHLLLNFDVSWLTHAAQQLLAGGNYINNFLETNPPLIIYLYTPLVFLKQTFGISTVEGIRLYVLAWSTLSLILCSQLLNGILLKNDVFMRHFFLFLLALVFLILPVNDFGQREHLTVILIFPYLLLLALRLQGENNPGMISSGLVGLMAGVGFCIKPYFLLPWAMVELYYLYRQRSLLAVFKPEAIMGAGFVGFYLAVIWLFHQDYIHQIIPIVTKFYYQRYQRPLWKMLLNEESVFNYFIFLFFLLRCRKLVYAELCKVLMIAGLGFWLVYLGQRMGWYYHALPFLSLELILGAILFLGFVEQKAFSRKEWLVSGGLTLALMAYYLIKIPYINLSAHFFPFSYFSFFFMIFFTLLYINAGLKLNWRLFFSLLILFSFNVWVYKYLIITVLYPHLFAMTITLMILTFGLMVQTINSVDKCRYIFLAILGMTLFALPAYKMAYIYSYASYYKMLYTQLIDNLKKYAGHKVIYLSNASEMAFPSLDYNGQIYSSRFWSLIWLPKMKHPYEVETYPAYVEENKEQLQFFMDAMLADFEKNKPEIVFVDVRAKGYYYTPAPKYVDLFSLHKDFRALWSQYHYVETLDQKPLFKLDVYRRG